MKKVIKTVLVLLAVVGMLLCLCGCTGLENMRKNQAFSGENGEILWNGAVYKALPESEYLFVDTGDFDDTVYLTEPDVPVLLSVFSEMWLYPSGDNTFLEEPESGIYYCREDQYENMLSRIQGGFILDVVCYSYYTGAGTQYHTLTNEQVEALEFVARNTEPTVLGDGMYLESDEIVGLQVCSKDMLFQRDYASISVSGNAYYLYWYAEGQEQLFAVPEEYRAVFAEIVETCLEKENEAWAYEEW